MLDSLLLAVIVAVVGSGGFLGIVFYFLRRWIERKIENVERKDKKFREQQARRYQLLEEHREAQGKLLFWIVRALQEMLPVHNINMKDIAEAYENNKETEAALKNFYHEQLAELNTQD